MLFLLMNLKEPIIGEMGSVTFGGVIGYSAGYALKKLFKLVLIITGLLFIVFQVLAHYQILIVNWIKIQTFVDSLFHKDTNSIVALLTANLPLAGSFVTGLVLGFKRG